jgi:hypothetical protein
VAVKSYGSSKASITKTANGFNTATNSHNTAAERERVVLPPKRDATQEKGRHGWPRERHSALSGGVLGVLHAYGHDWRAFVIKLLATAFLGYLTVFFVSRFVTRFVKRS